MIEVDLSGINYKGGPGSFVRGINQVLPYSTNKCHFVASPSIEKQEINERNNFDYLFLPFPFPDLKEKVYNE